jgi:ribose/xylose/arabinose/galactoside ABC-type transport system permease subunit
VIGRDELPLVRVELAAKSLTTSQGPKAELRYLVPRPTGPIVAAHDDARHLKIVPRPTKVPDRSASQARQRSTGVPPPLCVLRARLGGKPLAFGFNRWGRIFYAVGGNETAAYLAGAAVKRYRILAYVISATLAALGGIFVAARVGRGDVFAGSSLLLDSVAAALIGFAVLNQRRANVVGTAVGAVFVGIVLNGLTMLNVPYYTQDFVKGLVLVGALALTFGIGRGRR